MHRLGAGRNCRGGGVDVLGQGIFHDRRLARNRRRILRGMNSPDKGMSDAIRRYDANAANVSRRYEAVAAEAVHGWLVDLLPAALAHDLYPIDQPQDRRFDRYYLSDGFGTLENSPRIITDPECGP
jgi:hypothetical protein